MHKNKIGFAIVFLPLFLGVARAEDWANFRSDAGRTGYTPEQPPAKLALRWTFNPQHPPQPAWTEEKRIRFDYTHHVVADAERVYFGSSADGKVYALDAESGEQRWAFFTGAPIRFAPALWKDRLFVVSDDGYLYCLGKADGTLKWKKRAGPSDRMIFGNERMICKWPARGGPAVVDDVVYYGTGIWPSDGIFISAIDAATGKPHWINDSTGNMVLRQPHSGAVARSGVSCQGYIAVGKSDLWVPTGRSVPAAFDRQSGKFKFFNLQKARNKGSAAVAVIGSAMYNHYAVTASPEFIFTYAKGTLTATPRVASPVPAKGQGQGQGQGQEQGQPPDKPKKWVLKCPGGASLIAAGKTVICGAKDGVHGVGVEEKKVLWSQKISGTALGLAFSNGRVFVSTDSGRILCLAVPGEKPPNVVQAKTKAAPVAVNESIGSAVEEVLKISGVTEGYCLDLGCGSGQFALELARRTKLHIFGIEKDPAKVAAARKMLDEVGLYGVRVTIHQGDPAKTSYPNFFADLVVSENALSGGVVALDEVQRCLKPYGGVGCIGKPGDLKKTVRGPLEGVGEWTHQYANAGNTVCSGDPVKGPLSVLWFGSKDQVMSDRHGRAPAPLFSNGRLFVQGLNDIRAMDAYTGRVLWEYPLKGIGSPYLGDHLVGVAVTGSNLCTDGKILYVRMDDKCLRIDGATGKKLSELLAPPKADGQPGKWGYLAYRNGSLYGTLANEKHIVRFAYKMGRMEKQLSESMLIFSMDALSGKVKWTYKAVHSLRHNAIAVGKESVYLVDRAPAASDLLKSAPPKKGVPLPARPGLLVALDAESGAVRWKVEKDVFGTLLALSEDHDALLMAYQATRFKQRSEVGGRMAVFKASTGKVLWDKKVKYDTRPVMNDRTIYTQPLAYDLLSGMPQKGFNFKRSYGCGVLAGGRNLLVFRSATLGYLDLTQNKGTQNYGPTRPGCWLNAIPAGGLVLVPDFSERCSCSYLMKTSLALEPHP